MEMDVDPEIRDRYKEGSGCILSLNPEKNTEKTKNQRNMRRISKSLSGVANKATVSRSKGRVMASSHCYSNFPPPKDQDLEKEEEEEEEEEDDEFNLSTKTFIAFPKGYLGGGGFLIDKKETDNSTGGKSSYGKGSDRNYNYGQGQGTNEQGTGNPDYGGGCSGCHGCSRCPGCRNDCRYRSGGSN